jgi:uncharacterized protein YggE
MFRFTRAITIAAAAGVLVAGSSLTGVAVARRNTASSERKAFEDRIAALEAGSKARLDGLGDELSGLRQAVQSDGRTVKVTGEAYLPSNLNAVVIAFDVASTRSSIGDAISSVKFIATKVTAAVRNVGVASNDVRTIWDGAFPNVAGQGGTYNAHARVLTTVRHLVNIDRVSKAAMKASKDVTVAYLNVSDESNTAALAEARQDALKEARAKALRYAKAAGRTLGQLSSLSEQVSPESAPAEPGDGYSYRPAFIVIVEATYDLT